MRLGLRESLLSSEDRGGFGGGMGLGLRSGLRGVCCLRLTGLKEEDEEDGDG